MEHFISLIVDEKHLTDSLPKKWFKAAQEHLPAGVCTTFTQGEQQGRMKLTKKGGKATLTIPLTRNLTENEVAPLVHEFTGIHKKDFSISTSRIEIGLKNEVELEIPHEPLLDLCTAWAKQQHDEWMKDKTDAGWRYGPTVSMANKTHPLMRPWNDLPETYRKVDTKKAEELVQLFNEHGYVLVAKNELDQLLKDGDVK